MFERGTLPGIGVPARCADHETRLSRLEEGLGSVKEDTAYTRGRIDEALRRSARPPSGSRAKTIGMIVGAVGAALSAFAAHQGWL